MIDVKKLRSARVEALIGAAKRWHDSPGRQRAATPTSQIATRFAVRQELIQKAEELRSSGRMSVRLERVIGPTLDLVSLPPSEAARKVGRPVARIVQNAGPGLEPFGFATGFLVSPRLLLTNCHVFPDAQSVDGVKANFLYERSDRGIESGVLFDLDPTEFFICDDVLDFAIVGIRPTGHDGSDIQSLGSIPLIESASKILPGQGINIIEYPEGGAKQYAFTNNQLLDLLDSGFMRYSTDTEEGASGSPLFSSNWELVGLHHAGVPEMKDGLPATRDGSKFTEDTPDDEIVWIANEGIRISALVRRLTAMQLQDGRMDVIRKSLVENTSDPLDEVAKEILKSTDGSLPSISPSITSLGKNMTPNLLFQFSGPVTINVGTGTPDIQVSKVASQTPALEKLIRFDPDTSYRNRDGFDENFLGDDLTVPLPTISPDRMDEAFKAHGKPVVLKYHHYSVVMNKLRRLQMFSAVNVDYNDDVRDDRSRGELGTDKWIPDPRVPLKYQITDPQFYKPATKVDRGHIVRREDNAWGPTETDLDYANADTFHWTNCTPQHEAFNRSDLPSVYSGLRGIWGDFENHVKSELLRDGEHTACILAGPVLDNDHDPSTDFGDGPIQYPLRFWKVVVVADASGAGRVLSAHGFLFTQKDVVDRFGIEEFRPGKFRNNARSLTELSDLTGVLFDESLITADGLA